MAGRVDRLLVDDNQSVKKGDLVIVLDDRDFVATTDQKAAALDSARAKEGAVKASIDQAIAHVNSLQATVESDQAAADASRAQAEKAAKDFQRNLELFRGRVVSAQDLDAARATNDADQAQLQANLKKVASDRAQVAEARATVNTFLGLLKSAQAQIEEAAANLQAAKLNESYTEIRAPEDGRVTEKAVEPGDYVQRVPVKIAFDRLPEVGLPLGPGESVVPTVEVQAFRYLPFALLAMTGATAGLMLAMLWFRSRPKRIKAQR